MNFQIESAPAAPAGPRVPEKRAAKVRPPEIRFERHESPMAALRRAWQSRIAFVQKHHGNGLLGTEQEVHLLRLTVKRLRGYLQLVRPIVSDAVYREENRLLRDAARGLAGSRDYTVALRTIRELQKGASGKGARLALRKTGRAIDESGIAPGTLNGKRVTGEATGAAIAALEESFGRVARIEPRATGWAEMEGGLYHTYRRARHRFRRWLKTSDPEHAHDCRKYAKYLMFQLQLLEPMNPGRIEKLCRRLSKLECRLGRLNDLVTLDGRLEAELERGGISPSVRRAVGRVADGAGRKLAEASRKTGERLFERTAEAFVRALEKDWRRWKTVPRTTTRASLEVAAGRAR